MAPVKGPIKKGPSSIRSRQRRISPRPIASMGYSIPQAAYKNVRLLFSPDALPPCSTSPLFCTLAQRRITTCSHPFLWSTCATTCPTHQSGLCLVSDAIPISTHIVSVRTEPTPALLPFLPLLHLESATRLRPPCVPVWLELLLSYRIRPFLRVQSALHRCYTSSREGTRSMHLPPSASFISHHDRCLQCFKCIQCNDSIPSRSNRADHTGIGCIRRPIAAY